MLVWPPSFQIFHFNLSYSFQSNKSSSHTCPFQHALPCPLRNQENKYNLTRSTSFFECGLQGPSQFGSNHAFHMFKFFHKVQPTPLCICHSVWWHCMYIYRSAIWIEEEGSVVSRQRSLLHVFQPLTTVVPCCWDFLTTSTKTPLQLESRCPVTNSKFYAMCTGDAHSSNSCSFSSVLCPHFSCWPANSINPMDVAFHLLGDRSQASYYCSPLLHGASH